MKKTLNDKCMLCGCLRKDHEEGLGYCMACNPNCGVENGCMSFREEGNDRIINQYKKQIEPKPKCKFCGEVFRDIDFLLIHLNECEELIKLHEKEN